MGGVLVTGGTGAIGSVLADDLCRRGDGPIAVGSRDCDLLEPGAPTRLVDRNEPDGLVHLAWDVRGPGYARSEANERWLDASTELLEAFAAARPGGRAIVAGTCLEYDAASLAAGEPIREDAPLIDRGQRDGAGRLYAWAKRELLARATALEGLTLTWARIFFVFSDRDEPGRLVGDLLARPEQPVTIRAGGVIRDYLPARAVGTALGAIHATGMNGAVNVGSGRGTPVGELARVAAEALGLPAGSVTDSGAAPADQPASIVADVSRLVEGTPWRPPASTAEAAALELGAAR